MKVLHIINSLATGGAEKLILETLPLYNNKGITCDLLLLNGTSHPFLDELARKNCCHIYMLGKTSPYQIRFIFQLLKYFRKYDILHAHLFPSNYFLAVAKLISFSKKPIVFTEHSTSNRRFRNKKLRYINSFVYGVFNKIICITEEVKAKVIEQTGIDHSKFVVINNGVNVNTYYDASPLERKFINKHLSESDYLLLQVSSFRLAKDQKTVIKSLNLLPRNVKLLLAGEGSLLIEHKKLVEEMELQDRVFFLGNRADIPQLQQTVDLIMLSSNYEGLSLASLEAMSSGKPFIASDVPGLSDIVGGAGVLFPKGDEQILAKEIMKFFVSKEYSREISTKCLERAKNYDISIMIDNHIQLYQKIKVKEL